MRNTFLICIFVLMQAQLSFAKTIRVGGGAAPIENIFKKIKAPFKAASGIDIIINDEGPDIAMIELEAGHLDLATAGLPIENWLKMMKEMKHPVVHPEKIKSRTIGRDIIKVYTNPSVAKVHSLTTDQLKNIFTQKIKNWKLVGGPDLPITIVFGTKVPGTNRFWRERIMQGAAWPTNVLSASETMDIKKKIASTVGAIGIGPSSAKDDTLLAPHIETIGRPITAATVGVPSPEVLLLYKFIDGPGQEFINAKQ